MACQEYTEREFLTCSICLEMLKEPKTLTCLHRFCESCLHAHIMASVTSDGYSVRSFSCPLCRIKISAPSYSTLPSSWAAQFKTDFDVKNLIELVQSRKELPEIQIPQIKYPSCPKHTNKECGYYCVDCRQTSCDTCAILSHRACNQMLTVEDAAKDRRAAIRSQISDMSEQINQAVQLESLREDYMKLVEEQKEQAALKIRETADKLREVVSSQEGKLLKHLEKNYDGLQEKVSLKVSIFEETVNNARDAIKNAFSTMSVSDFELMSDDSCCNALASCDITNATDEHTRFCKKLCEVKCLFKKDSIPDITLGKCVIFYNLSDDDISANSKSEVNNGGLSGNLGASTVLPQDPGKLSYATVCTGDKPKNIPPKAYIQNTPNETRQKATTSNKPTEAVQKAMIGGKPRETLPTITPDDTALPASKAIRTIKIRLRHDSQKPCLNCLIVMVPTDTVLATDWANKCVKAFPSRKGHRNTSLALDSPAWAITQVSNTSAAVSLPSSQQICFIKVTPALDIDKYIKVSKSYQGLAAFISLDSVIIVAGSSQNSGGAVASVDFLTTSGQMLKSFTRDSSGLPLFKDPASLCVTRDIMIVVSDVGNKNVKYLTMHGEHKFTYPPEGAECLRSPKGVTCHPSGRIILVEDGDLLSLTCDGQLEKTLVSFKDSLVRLSGTLAADKGGHVYVVDNDEDIKVFRCVGL